MKIAIAGGGTGGHIYPAMALADALCRQDSKIQVILVGSKGGMEEKLFPSKYERHFVRSAKWVGAGRFQKILLPFLFLRSAIESALLFWKTKPDLVIGVGGYASFFFTLVSSFFTDTCIWEPNARPGRSNLWLSWFVRRVFVVFPQAKDFFGPRHKLRQGFMPLRAEFYGLVKGQSVSGAKRLLVFGGSQGARAINQALREILSKGLLRVENLEIVHQIGARDFESFSLQMKSEVSSTLMAAYHPRPYIENMIDELLKADVVVCRSGAASVHEVVTCEVPAVFVPLSSAADDHQRWNALAMSEDDFALMVDERSAQFATELASAINKLLYDNDLLAKIKSRLRSRNKINGSDQLASAILKGD